MGGSPFNFAVWLLAELQIQMFSCHHGKFRVYHSLFFYNDSIVSVSLSGFCNDFYCSCFYSVYDPVFGYGGDRRIHVFVGDDISSGDLFCLTEMECDLFGFCLGFCRQQCQT